MSNYRLQKLQHLKKRYMAEGYKMAIRKMLKESSSVTQEQLLTKIEAEEKKAKGAWGKAVMQDAYSLIEELDEEQFQELVNAGNFSELRKILLGGARDEKQWSEGGMGLISDYDIAKHYCSPSELKKVKDGQRQPNSRETWIDVQARAIGQAIRAIARLF